MYEFLVQLLKGLKKIARYRFFYFVMAVVILVVLADNYSQAYRGKLQPGNRSSITFSKEEDSAVSKSDSLINFAISLKGIPYQYAGNSVKGFDCSGFTYYVFNRFDIPIPRSSSQQYLAGEAIPTSEVKKVILYFLPEQKTGMWDMLE